MGWTNFVGQFSYRCESMSLLTQGNARSLYTWVLYLLFFLSGATGLIYEIMWNRKLTLIFGSTVYSVTTILTVFFAGLALGAYLIGRRVDHVRSPLYLYIAVSYYTSDAADE